MGSGIVHSRARIQFFLHKQVFKLQLFVSVRISVPVFFFFEFLYCVLMNLCPNLLV